MRYDNNIEVVPNLELTDKELETVSGGAIYTKFSGIEGDVKTEGCNWVDLALQGLWH